MYTFPLPRTETHCNTLQHTATHCHTLRTSPHIHYPALQRTALHTANICITPKRHTQLFHPTDRHTPTHCHMLPHTTHTLYPALQRTAANYTCHTYLLPPGDILSSFVLLIDTLQRTATRCHTCTHIYYPALQRTTHITYIYYPQAILNSFIPRRRAHYNALQNTATDCTTLQQTTHSYLHLLPQATYSADSSRAGEHTAPHCTTLHHTAPHCTTLHTSTHI